MNAFIDEPGDPSGGTFGAFSKNKGDFSYGMVHSLDHARDALGGLDGETAQVLKVGNGVSGFFCGGFGGYWGRHSNSQRSEGKPYSSVMTTVGLVPNAKI